jgi:hypothetical protein
MTKQVNLQGRVQKEIASLQKTLEELRLMEMVTKDLRRIKKMIPIKKFD